MQFFTVEDMTTRVSYNKNNKTINDSERKIQVKIDNNNNDNSV